MAGEQATGVLYAAENGTLQHKVFYRTDNEHFDTTVDRQPK